MSKYMKYDRIYKITWAHEIRENVGSGPLFKLSLDLSGVPSQNLSGVYQSHRAKILPSLLVLICYSVKPSKDVYLQWLFPSIDLWLVNAELLVMVSKAIAAVTSDVT